MSNEAYKELIEGIERIGNTYRANLTAFDATKRDGYLLKAFIAFNAVNNDKEFLEIIKLESDYRKVGKRKMKPQELRNIIIEKFKEAARSEFLISGIVAKYKEIAKKEKNTMTYNRASEILEKLDSTLRKVFNKNII